MQQFRSLNIFNRFGIIKFSMANETEKLSKLFSSSTSGTFKDDKVDHLFNESAALNVYDKSIINLAAGCPGPDLLKPVAEMMRKAVTHRMSIEDKNNYYLFQYGPTSGVWGMRDELANFLTKKYGDVVKREELILTCGATHGLHLLVSTILAPNGIIFVEEYTFMIALHLFKEFPNFKIVQVPLTSEGVDADKLYDIVKTVKLESSWNTNDEKPFWAIFYTIPNFHNPTGILLPPDKCKKLVDIARELDFLVVCDDVYNLLYYGNNEYPPARLYSYDKKDSKNYKGGHVVSNGSFSKILAPGVRVGWMELPIRLALKFRQSGIMQGGGSVNNVMFGLIQSLLELGLAENHLEWYKNMYRERLEVFCKGLELHLPKGCKFLKPEGGYFVWVEIPVNSTNFLSWCMKNGGPGAVASERFNLDSATSYSKNQPVTDQKDAAEDHHSSAIRLTIGFHDTDTLKASAELLGNRLKEYIELTQKRTN